MKNHPIEIQRQELHRIEVSRTRKEPEPFPKQARREPVSKEVKNKTLSALNSLLKKQKLSEQIAEGQAFSQLLASEQIATENGTVLKIDPSSEVMQLFAKLADSLVHTHKNGITKTTLFLDGDAFSRSLFHGAKITITEYSTAPKIFNIQFGANPQALAFFQGHAASLLAALQNGKFGFDVHRLETEALVEEKPLIAAVENATDKEEKGQ